MFTALVGLDVGSTEWWKLEDLLRKQIEIQEKLAEAQIRLTNAQSEYMELLNDRMKKGEAVQQVFVSVEGDTEAWLQGLIEELFKEIMVKATSESFSCLGNIT